MKFLFALFLFPFSLNALHIGNTIPFSRGVNLSAWLQEANARQIQFTKYTKSDFQKIKSLGCDVIRLPINFHGMTTGAPEFIVDPLLFDFIDEAVNWAEELGLHIILDNHSFDPAVSTSPLIGNTLVPVWKQVAFRMKNRSSLVVYEILNEPHGIADFVWNAIQDMVIDSIRSVDTVHTIIVGPAGWNSYANLHAMPVYSDTNLIYTFHFYDPFIFTHQGASWSDPSMAPLAGVPFPYDLLRMPPFPSELTGTWIQNAFNSYSTTGTAPAVKNLIDIAADFKSSRNVQLFCGEFGVYIPNSANEDRVLWYELVRTYLEGKGIAWTSWDYQGGFGLFEKGTDELFEYDLNIPLINALGFTVAPQKVFSVLPDSTQFDLYNDYSGPRILTYGNGTYTDFYSSIAPAAGKYCIRFANAPQYESIKFDFKPTRDLSLLKNNGFVFEFNVRSNSPGLQFDVRFLDTKDGPSDHPWRMRKTITSEIVAWNDEWHRVRIPLANFVEHGSWDDGWYNPIGAFDWKAIDQFEIVAEQSALTGKEVYFDDIRIISLVPAAIIQLSSLPQEFCLFQNYPNPFNPVTIITFSIPHTIMVSLKVYDVTGKEVAVLLNEEKTRGLYSVQCNASSFASGVYFYRLQAGTYVETKKLVVMK
ncbi:MAG: cellulase family glycosylhydrolase [Ignavibacteriales bacterium]|nr:cellulase family glycosylhydrolase [Ignavibacteriales bacterium]